MKTAPKTLLLLTVALSSCTDAPAVSTPERGAGRDSGAIDTATDTASDTALDTTADTTSADTAVADTAPDTAADTTADTTPTVCPPNARECLDTSRFRICAADGSQWNESACGGATYCDQGLCRDQACVANVMFLIDGSSSMGSEFPNVRRSVANVISANPEVAFGLSMFPVGLGCSIGDGTPGLFQPAVNWPHVPVTLNASSPIDSWFASNDAAGGATPLISAMEWFAENAPAVWGDALGGAYLVVMTEGADTCRCDQQDPDRSGCLVDGLSSATRALAAAGVKTYVIGYQYGEEPEALNAIAQNGGTTFTEFVYAGNEASLTSAFESIVADAKLCF